MIEKANNKKTKSEEFYEDEILVRRVYKSFKGDLVMVFGLAKEESRDINLDGREVVIYADLNSGEMKIREKSTWFEKHPVHGPRFVLGDVTLGKIL